MRNAHATHNTRRKILYRSKHDDNVHTYAQRYARIHGRRFSLPLNENREKSEAKSRAEQRKNAETEKDPRLSTLPHLDNR